jgi:hypothetical protein
VFEDFVHDYTIEGCIIFWDSIAIEVTVDNLQLEPVGYSGNVSVFKARAFIERRDVIVLAHQRQRQEIRICSNLHDPVAWSQKFIGIVEIEAKSGPMSVVVELDLVDVLDA